MSSRRTRWRTSRCSAPASPVPLLPHLPLPPPSDARYSHMPTPFLLGADQDPGQRGHPARPAASDLRRQAAGGRPHSVRLQHPKGEHPPPGPAPARRPRPRRGRQRHGRLRHHRASVRGARCNGHVGPVRACHLHNLAADLARGGRDSLHPSGHLRSARRGARPPPLSHTQRSPALPSLTPSHVHTYPPCPLCPPAPSSLSSLIQATHNPHTRPCNPPCPHPLTRTAHPFCRLDSACWSSTPRSLRPAPRAPSTCATTRRGCSRQAASPSLTMAVSSRRARSRRAAASNTQGCSLHHVGLQPPTRRAAASTT